MHRGSHKLCCIRRRLFSSSSCSALVIMTGIFCTLSLVVALSFVLLPLISHSPPHSHNASGTHTTNFDVPVRVRLGFLLDQTSSFFLLPSHLISQHRETDRQTTTGSTGDVHSTSLSVDHFWEEKLTRHPESGRSDGLTAFSIRQT